MADGTTTQKLLNPLAVIALFVTLTEAVLGVGVIQTQGTVQAVLTGFVVGFPVLISAAFFTVLWFKPFVLYSPYEFGSAADAATFIAAVTRSAATAESKATEAVQAAEEIKALREQIAQQAKDVEEKLRVAEHQTLARIHAFTLGR